ncbi:efflux RND transporter periplasmic adaptor subunit [Rhodanobacter glycinis]|uniref:Membrane fusion protein, multidrug efflux system n=1 Tax=Rhodanobacter glycinis TaxID=582702 RepID=A0A1I3ZZG7_9GAMM|nr:efflux RND transporter periplasmic adaptor subunit [Rhodanobacter glycinis]SFK49036.1 membrane fusion protein, multidrug efflux system [Rhodanobacter glycinis]
MQRNSRKNMLLAVVALAIIGVALHGWLGSHEKAHATKAPPVVPVKVAVAARGNLDLALKVIGRAEAYSTVTVQSRVSGQLQSLAFTPGGHVHAGQVIAQIDPSLLQAQLDQARGELAKDQAQLTQARSVLARYTPLLSKGYVSKTDYDNYKANVGIYAASVKADQAAVEMARTQLGYARITAPVNSIAGAPLVYPGAQVTANGTDLVVLNQVQPIYITFSVPEASLDGIRAAFARGKVAVSATVPGTRGAPLTGTLDFINNTVDAGTGTIQLKAESPNTDDRVTPGQFLQVSLPTTRLVNVVTVPVEALQNSPKGSFVFVVSADHTVQQRMVTAGPDSHGRLVISKGLAGGETVVTDGQMLLTNGSHVKVVKG